MSADEPRDNAEQAEEDEYEISLPYWLLGVVGFWLLVALAGAIGLVLLWSGDGGYRAAFGFAYRLDDHANPPVRSLGLSADELVSRLGFRDALLFARLDRDGNGLISMTEFEPLVHHIRQDWRHPLTLQAAAGGGDQCVGDSCVQLRYRLAPPAASGLLLYANQSQRLQTVGACSDDKAVCELLQNLANFSTAGAVDKTVSVDAVTIATALLPHSRQSELRVGSPYYLIGPAQFEYFLRKQRRLHPGVYFQPGEAALAALLRPLHPNVFLLPRYGARASAAVVRAISDTHVDILFRLHVELQVANESSRRSVYLTPGGVEGRVILPRGGQPKPLLLAVRLAAATVGGAARHNCEVEVARDSVLSGQAWLPELSITVATPDAAPSYNWSEELPAPVATRRLRSKLLPHLAADFHNNVANAVAAAAAAAKRLHVVVAVGSPDQAGHEYSRVLQELALADTNVDLRLKYYYVNVWINFADLALPSGKRAALAGLTADQASLFESLLSTARQPLAAFLLDSGLNRLSAFTADQLQAAMKPPADLPDPYSPPPEPPRPALTPGGSKEPSPEPQPDPEESRRLEQEAMEAIRKQVASAYIGFLVQRQAE